ncbi:MAG: hypothetical protein ABI947_21930 [Chloroflexota bacterium]
MRNRWLIGAMAACLTFCAVLALDWIPGLRGDFGWRWPYAVPDWPRLLPAAITVMVYVFGVSRIRNMRLFVVWCMLGAIAIPIACLYLLGDPLHLLATRVLSGQATGVHMAGAEIVDLGQMARNWPQIMPTYYHPGNHPMMSVHVALSPPGLPMFYYTLDRLFAAIPPLANSLGLPLRYFQCQDYAMMNYSNAQFASAWFGILMPVWAALAVIPLYRAGGKLVASWWPLIPSLILFATTWNTFYPLLALGAFLFLRAGLLDIVDQSRRKRGYLNIAAAGVVVSLASFLNISNLPLIAFLGLYGLIVFVQRWDADRANMRRTVISGLITGVIFAVGLLSLWAVYYLTSGVTPMAVVGTALGLHLGFERPYLPWVYLHLYDLALFTGFPVIILALAAIWKNVPYRRAFDWQTLDPLGIALIVTLIILVIGNFARGETGRVWLFFVPFILILAARQLDKLPPRSAMLVTITQAIMLLTLVGFLRVLDTEFGTPPTAPPNDQASVATEALPVSATFANSFTLIGEKVVTSDNNIYLTLTWRPDQQIAIPYYLSALVVGPDGKALPPAVDWQPFETRFPMTCWKPGQTVTETRQFALGDKPPSGDYWISLSAFDIRDKQRLSIVKSGSAPADQIGLGPIPLH